MPRGIESPDNPFVQTLTLDSNILIYHLRGDHAVRDALARWLLQRDHLFISAITRIEVLAAPTLKPEEEADIQRLLDGFRLLSVDTTIADVAARIRRTHRLKLDDSIIAASALLTSSTLVTRNIRDFKKTSELSLLKL